MFSASFTLGPLFLLLIVLFDIRVDAKRLIWLHRRPVARRVQNIGRLTSKWNIKSQVLINQLFLGMFKYLLLFLNIVGIGVNGFLVAMTSTWANLTFNSTENLLILVSIFEVLL